MGMGLKWQGGFPQIPGLRAAVRTGACHLLNRPEGSGNKGGELARPAGSGGSEGDRGVAGQVGIARSTRGAQTQPDGVEGGVLNNRNQAAPVALNLFGNRHRKRPLGQVSVDRAHQLLLLQQ